MFGVAVPCSISVHLITASARAQKNNSKTIESTHRFGSAQVLVYWPLRENIYESARVSSSTRLRSLDLSGAAYKVQLNLITQTCVHGARWAFFDRGVICNCDLSVKRSTPRCSLKVIVNSVTGRCFEIVCDRLWWLHQEPSLHTTHSNPFWSPICARHLIASLAAAQAANFFFITIVRSFILFGNLVHQSMLIFASLISPKRVRAEKANETN